MLTGSHEASVIAVPACSWPAVYRIRHVRKNRSKFAKTLEPIRLGAKVQTGCRKGKISEYFDDILSLISDHS